MRKKLLGVLAASLFVLSPIAAAEVQINGFASVVSGIDLEDDGQSAYGSRTVDNLQQSKVALQWTANLDQGMRFVGQTMARGDATDGFSLNYDWAYFDFNIGDSGKLKLGRLRIPFYKYSDYLDVGYAYHWINPPASMYSLSFSNMDGIGYQQNIEAGGMEHALNIAAGAYQGVLFLGGAPTDSKLENLVAINWSASIGEHEFYAAYAQADVYVPATSTISLSAVATLGGDDPNKVLINGDYGHFVGIGYKGSFGDISLFAEYSLVGVDDSIFSDSEGGYIGMSYIMDDYTYHITYGLTKSDEKTYAATTDTLDLGLVTTAQSIGAAAAAASTAAGNSATDAATAGLVATGTFLATAGAGDAAALSYASNSNLNSIAKSLGNGDSSTITLGVRKDIGTSTALKLDLDLYTEDRVQTDQVGAASEEMKATTIKFAIETMF